MEGIENQTVVDPRTQLVDRMKSRYPDRNFDMSEGQDGQSSLEQSIIDAFGEMDSQISDYEAKQKVYNDNTAMLTNLFSNSPRAAVFMNTLATSGDPAGAFYKAYGRDAFEAFSAGDASELITQIEAEDAKNRADNEQFEAEKSANLQESFKALDEWGDSKGLSDEDKVAVFMRFYNILNDALVGKYSSDLFEMAWRSDHYEGDVESARHEGEVAGRNANIQAQARKRNESTMPPALSGQGVRQQERRPVKEDNPWML